MQWLYIATALLGAPCASAENGKGQISSVFEDFGYSPACVASVLTTCEYSSTKELSVNVVDSIEVTKSLLQEMKSERENSTSIVKSLLQEMKSERENSASVVQTLLKEMKSEVQAVRPKSEDENSLSLVKSLFQEIKSEVTDISQEMKLQGENSSSIVKTFLQEIRSDRENSKSIVKSLFQEMKSEIQAVRQDMKLERDNSVVKTLLQEMKSERENEKNSIEILLGNLENITHRISTLEVILQEATSERKNVSHSLADMKTFIQEIRTEQENDFATTVNNSCVNIINPQKNCADLRVLGDELSVGVQTVYPYLPNPKSVVVFCDQVTDGGGWTVIQSRSPLLIRENFTRNWNEYVQGFGDPKGEFWLGLDNIHALTNSAQMELRVDLEDAEGQKRFAKYRTFHVGDAASKYVLRIEGYSGDAGEGMTITQNGMKFSTFDNDNDLVSSGNCAKSYHGGWWFNACFYAHLNGLPFVGKVLKQYEGIQWRTFLDGYHSLKKANMKIRPVSLGF